MMGLSTGLVILQGQTMQLRQSFNKSHHIPCMVKLEVFCGKEQPPGFRFPVRNETGNVSHAYVSTSAV